MYNETTRTHLLDWGGQILIIIKERIIKLMNILCVCIYMLCWKNDLRRGECVYG